MAVLVVVIATVGTLVGFARVVRRPGADPHLQVVQMAGSSSFFDDQAVVAEFRAHGLTLNQSNLGSYQIANEKNVSVLNDLANADGQPAGRYIESKVARHGRFPLDGNPYSSPMVIVTYPPIVTLLERQGVVHENAAGIPIFDIAQYLKLVAHGTKWTDIPGNTTYPNGNRVMVTTTDPMYSNSGGVFMAILSYVLNHGAAPAGVGDLTPAQLSLLQECFAEQGTMELHTPDLLSKFATDGMDAYPMALVYESDALEAKLGESGTLPSDTVLMYPSPNIVSDNTLVAFDDLGQRVINMLTPGNAQSDPALIGLEQRDGFRTSADRETFVHYMAGRHVNVVDLDQSGLQVGLLPEETTYRSLIETVG